MRTKIVALVFCVFLCCPVSSAFAVKPAMLESGYVETLIDRDITLVIPGDYEKIDGKEGYGIYFQGEHFAIGVTIVSYTSFEEFRAVLRDVGIGVLSEKNSTINGISVSLLTPDKKSGRYAIAALQSAPENQMLILDFLPNPENSLGRSDFDAAIARVLHGIRRPEGVMEKDLTAINEYFQGSDISSVAYTPRLVSYSDLGCSFILPGSMVKFPKNNYGEMAVYKNDFITVYFFLYDGWTIADYEAYAGVDGPDFAVDKYQMNGFDARVYEYLGHDETQDIAAAALYSLGQGKKLEIAFVPRFQDRIDEIWQYISMITGSIMPYGADGADQAAQGIKQVDPSEAADRAVALGEKLFDFYEMLLRTERQTASAIKQYAEKGDYAALLAARRDTQALPYDIFSGMISETISLNDLKGMGMDLDDVDASLLYPCTMYFSTLNETLNIQRSFTYAGFFSHELTEQAVSRAENAVSFFEIAAQMQPCVFSIVFQDLMEEPAMQRFWQTVPEKWPNVGMQLQEEMNEKSVEQLYYTLYLKLAHTSEIESLLNDSHNAVRAQIDGECLSGQIEEKRKADYYVPDQMPVIVSLPDDWLFPHGASLQMALNEATAQDRQAVSLILSGVREEAFTDYTTRMFSTMAKRSGSASEGWVCRLDALDLSIAWNPDQTVAVLYDPALCTVETVSTNLLLMLAAD